MSRNKSQRKALTAVNYDLFRPEDLSPPAPATLYTAIRQHQSAAPVVSLSTVREVETGLPDTSELYRMFDRFNWLYFDGRLPRVKIEYSTRMSSAGSYTPQRRLIRIGRKYHQLLNRSEVPPTVHRRNSRHAQTRDDPHRAFSSWRGVQSRSRAGGRIDTGEGAPIAEKTAQVPIYLS
jgi:hypothetical protein